MAGLRNMQQGIDAIQHGNLPEGARLLKIALLDATLSGAMRATIYIWLAETDPNPTYKIQCYHDALNADPGNNHAQTRLDHLLNSGNIMPPTPSLTSNPQTPPPAAPVAPAAGIPAAGYADAYPAASPAPAAYPAGYPAASPAPYPAAASPTATPPPSTAMYFRTVSIIDGPNGPGTGFFVTLDGMIATSRLVVSGMENVVISLDATRQLVGKVVRAYPEYDLAFIKVALTLSHNLPFTGMPTLPDNMEITAVAHDGQLLRGRIRATKRDMKPHWFPTTIRQLADTGGNPVFDEHNYLVGMLTRNTSRASADVFGLHINAIRRQLEDYQREIQLDPHRAYCPNCGYISRAENFGAFYCEVCGSVLPKARGLQRFLVPQAATLYGENLQRPCRHCDSRVGYYNGRCLRCGNDV